MKRVIGLTGGVGSGKSSVLKILKETYGADIIQADLVAAELEEPGREGYLALLKQFGEGILREDRTIDRGRFAALIFADKQALETVNRLIHPMTWARIRELTEESKAELVVVEAALLDKTGDIYDELWYVYTSEENRIRRLMESRGYSRDKVLSIIANQPSEKEFLQAADAVIDNNGSPQELNVQIKDRLER